MNNQHYHHLFECDMHVPLPEPIEVMPRLDALLCRTQAGLIIV